MTPEVFQSYRMDDLYLALRGWSDEKMFNLTMQRRLTEVVANVTNVSMGGKGATDYVHAMIPLGEKEKKVGFTPEQISYMIREHNKNMKRIREERDRKKLDNGENKPA